VLVLEVLLQEMVDLVLAVVPQAGVIRFKIGWLIDKKGYWVTFGRHSGAYSPPDPCFDLTLMSSAISLERI
jgi:hypothetical protein